jgi:hypothetical protein
LTRPEASALTAGRERALPDDLAHDRGLFKSPGGGQRNDVARREIGLVSLPRNQFAAAGPIVPLTNSARRLARTIER